MSSTPDSSQPTTTGIPERLEFGYGTYKALQAQGSGTTFFAPAFQALINGEGKPLARFLPKAGDPPDGQGGNEDDKSGRAKFGSVTYTLPADAKTACRLRFKKLNRPGSKGLTSNEITEFANAIQKFQTDEIKNPLLREYRAAFRLPNPESDPDAYWVVGKDTDRRLVILWGCEHTRALNTSRPLDEVVAYIRENCEIDDDERRELGMKIALGGEDAISHEPISRFLTTKHDGRDDLFDGRDKDGNKIIIAAGDLKPFKDKGFCQSEFDAFDQAATDFIGKNPGTSEAEARKALRLPSIGFTPERFYRNGSNLLIDVTPSLDQAKCVPPAPLPEPLPEPAPVPVPAPAGRAARQPAPPDAPLNRQLNDYIKFQYWREVYAGAAALVVVIAAIVWFAIIPPPPPLARINRPVSPDGNSIEITFNRELAANIPNNAVVFVGTNTLGVTGLGVSGSNPSVLVVKTASPLVDGKIYLLELTTAIKDASNRALPNSNQARLDYVDKTPPKLADPVTGVSAGRTMRELLLTFDKDIDPASLRDSADAITIKPIINDKPGEPLAVRNVVLDTTTRDRRRVIVTTEKDFVTDQQYSLSVAGQDGLDGQDGKITDTTRRRNSVSIRQPHFFRYQDVLPPVIRGDIAASGATRSIQIKFSKPLDATAATTPGNYSLTPTTKDDPQLKIRDVTVNDKDGGDGKVVTLRFEPGILPRGNVRLVVSNIEDRNHNKIPNPLEPDAFQFSGYMSDALDLQAIDSVKVNTTGLTLAFTKLGILDSSVSKNNFQIACGKQLPAPPDVNNAEVSPDDARNIFITLSGSLVPGGAYQLVINGLEDTFGIRQGGAISKGFNAPGALQGSAALPLNAVRATRNGNQIRLTIQGFGLLTEQSANDAGNYTVLQPEGIHPANATVDTQGGAGNAQVILVFRPGDLKSGVPITIKAANLIFKDRPDQPYTTSRPIPVE